MVIVKVVREKSDSRGGLIGSRMMGGDVKGLEVSVKLKNESVEEKDKERWKYGRI